MKLFALSLTLVLALAVTVACASSGADLYNSKCSGCHGKDGAKAAASSGNVTLKGQSAADIETKLKGYVDGSFGGKKMKVMQKMAGKLSPEETTAVAEHIATL
ncbi:MAG: c-type cytochrome [Proteobacteria bacterium]|nr:c-type cytochrome [Pseudomonadota bacterium]MBU1611082.1 c-type cytochrome [Pseudomonadota bacterium]